MLVHNVRYPFRYSRQVRKKKLKSKMPSWRNSPAKRKEKSAARARRHRESLGIPEWPPQEEAEFNELASLGNEELLEEIDKFLAADDQSPCEWESSAEGAEREDQKKTEQIALEPSTTAAVAADHTTGREEQKTTPYESAGKEALSGGEQTAPVPSMAAVDAADHTTGIEEQELPPHQPEEEDFVLQLVAQEPDSFF